MSENSDIGEFQVSGTNDAALFTLKLHRGDGMVLIGMNWKKDKPPEKFVGFAIESMDPGAPDFRPLPNRISFPDLDGNVDAKTKSSRLSPFQKFRWVHFPANAELKGEFTYKVTPVFMDDADVLSYGEPQIAKIQLRRETYPGQLNVTFTRGFVSSQAFVDHYGADAIKLLLPAKADDGLTFDPEHPKAAEALAWMGFEARSAIIEVLDDAIADKSAKVGVVVYDLNEPGVVTRLEQIGAENRLQVIIDDDGAHGEPDSAETQSEVRLIKAAGDKNVKRQHMGKLQHNKMVVVQGGVTQAAVVGSCNHSWRGFFVQNNNAIILHGEQPVAVCRSAFDAYWNNEDNSVADFAENPCSSFCDLALEEIDARVAFSPRTKKQALLDSIAKDISSTTSSLFFSLAFLYQTKGVIQDAFKQLKEKKQIFSYGISDHMVEGLEEEAEVSGIDLQKPDGDVIVVSPSALTGEGVPEPFKSEPTGGGGTRMHHKFVVIDFDKPTARVYMGSFNFSSAADTSNGENLLLIKDRRIAVSYVVEAVRIFDHCHFRVAQMEAKSGKKTLVLAKPPRKAGEKPWFEEDYSNARKILDRELFA